MTKSKTELWDESKIENIFGISVFKVKEISNTSNIVYHKRNDHVVIALFKIGNVSNWKGKFNI